MLEQVVDSQAVVNVSQVFSANLESTTHPTWNTSKTQLMTKFCDAKNIQDIVNTKTFHCAKGRSRVAFTAELDGLSRGGLGKTGKQELQDRRETREHSLSSEETEIQSERRKSGVGHEWKHDETASGGNSNSSS